MGSPRDTAQNMVDAFDAMDRQSMIDLADAYDPAIPPTENKTYIDAVKEIRGPRAEELGREMAAMRDSVTPDKDENAS